MEPHHLKKKYSILIKKAEIAKSRKETISLLKKAEKVHHKVYFNEKKVCTKCNGLGHKRISLENAKTCLNCFGTGYVRYKL